MSRWALAVLVPPTSEVRQVLGDWPVVVGTPGDLVEVLDAVPPHTTHLVLVGERRHDALVRRHAALLSDRGLAVAHRSLPHGPAALLVMAIQAAAGSTDPGLVPAVLDGYAAATWSAAWTPSVTKLVEPAPSLGQHVRSLLPSAGGFLVQLSGDARVVPVGPRIDPVEGPERATMLVSGAGVPQQALDGALRLSGAREHALVEGLRVDPLERFGSARAVELVALPGTGVRVPHDPSTGWCDVCGAAVPDTLRFCSYCHVRPLSETLVPRGAQ